MNRFAVLYLLVLFLSATGLPEAVRSEEPMVSWGTYVIPFTYDDSAIKSDGFTAGLYTYLGYGPHHSLETAIDYTRIDFKNLEELRQWDYTAVYTHYRGGYEFRGGLHFISANYNFTDGLVTAIAGLGYYDYGSWHAAVNGYYTWYNDSEPDLNIFQATPEIGRYFFKTPTSWLRIVARGYYINADEGDAVFGLEDDYLSAEAELTWYRDGLTLKGFGWAGEQVFAVHDDGFVIYNLLEKHKGGFGAGLDYLLDNGLLLGFEVAVERFEDFGIDADATRVTYLLIVGSRF